MASLDLLDIQLANRPIMEDTTRMSEDKNAEKSERLTESAPLKYPVTPDDKRKLDEALKKLVTYKPKPKSE